MSKEKLVEELSEDIEVVGPGQMLREAREKLGLTQQQVADRLNFRTTLVKDIEQEIFDKTLPATFNRGYIKNYAKLVNISIDDVLASYEMLNIAQKQGAEMQSFSKETEKQAESNRIMWISYLILATLIGSTVVWWFQDIKKNNVPQQPLIEQPENDSSKLPVSNAAENTVITVDDVKTDEVVDKLNQALDNTVSLSETLKSKDKETNNSQEDFSESLDNEDVLLNGNNQEQSRNAVSHEINNLAEPTEELQSTQTEELKIDTDFGAPEAVEFTFSGDCWVNIYDATGERIAWGIKKSGYIMNVSGQAPFTITLGKPELVNITFEQQPVDMSQFSRGNIAKFTLPLQSSN